MLTTTTRQTNNSLRTACSKHTGTEIGINFYAFRKLLKQFFSKNKQIIIIANNKIIHRELATRRLGDIKGIILCLNTILLLFSRWGFELQCFN